MSSPKSSDKEGRQKKEGPDEKREEEQTGKSGVEEWENFGASDKKREKEKKRRAEPTAGHSRLRSLMTLVLIFSAAFFAAAGIIRIDTAAGNIIGNEPFFSSGLSARMNIRWK